MVEIINIDCYEWKNCKNYGTINCKTCPRNREVLRPKDHFRKKATLRVIKGNK